MVSMRRFGHDSAVDPGRLLWPLLPLSNLHALAVFPNAIDDWHHNNDRS